MYICMVCRNSIGQDGDNACYVQSKLCQYRQLFKGIHVLHHTVFTGVSESTPIGRVVQMYAYMYTTYRAGWGQWIILHVMCKTNSASDGQLYILGYLVPTMNSTVLEQSLQDMPRKASQHTTERQSNTTQLA